MSRSLSAPEGVLRTSLEIPDPWQQEALAALRAGNDVIIDAPTGAGKTRVFEWWVEAEGARRGGVVFTVPTRALANDKFREWQERGWKVGLVTGDRTENPRAPVLVATLETQRERLLSGSPPQLLAVDEYQLLAHEERGVHYEMALALAPATTRLLLLSGSVANPHEVAAWLRRLGREVVVVQTRERPVPLEECPVARLPCPVVPGRRRDSLWARLARGVLRAGLTPLLIFAPRRAEAERIARALAAELTPDPGFHLEPSWREILGPSQANWLQRRVAVHHSGQTASHRGGLIEPLAKHGHLDFLVATTGLAAGIHFSVRSVLVTETRFFDGRRERELRPDELLQMFGRAGRRGLDTLGTVLTLPHGVGLGSAAPLPVRCPSVLDWAALMRAVEGMEDPIESLAETIQRLFRTSVPEVGLEAETAPPPAESRESRPLQDAWRKEVLDPVLGWVPHHTGVRLQQSLAQCERFYRGEWRTALSTPEAELFPGPGRLCRLYEKNPATPSDPSDSPLPPAGTHQTAPPFIYGREETVALAVPEEGRYRLVGDAARRLGVARRETFSTEDLQGVVRPLLESQAAEVAGRRLVGLREKNGVVAARWDFSACPVEAWMGTSGRALMQPPIRWVEAVTGVEMQWRERTWVPPAGSLLRCWRELGLWEADGHPTPRGHIFARFQGGEGLLIAAALEQGDYAAADIVRHLANIRGGHRFAEVPEQGSARLAAAARSVFGHRTIEGVLIDGLPPSYGENTAEALALLEEGGGPALARYTREAGRGDAERARLEWISLLRQISRAAFPVTIPGWPELASAAREVLEGLPKEKEWPGISGRWRQTNRHDRRRSLR